MHRIAALVATCAVSVLAGDAVLFKNGARVEVERTEREGSGVWLYAKSGMTTHVELSEILRIDPIVPPGQTPATPAPVVFTPRDQDTATKRLVEKMAARHGVDPDLVHAVVKQESNYHAKAVSSAGAIGLMQLMPGTARDLAADPWVPEENVDAGVRYLRQLLIKYKNSPNQVALALAAYNAGPNAVDRYRGIPPYRETRQYVRKVIRNYDAAPDRTTQPAPASATQHDTAGGGGGGQP
ncbi:MAG: lytic transglycosylase domain-containing protein [Bryobacteraceae bacterium]